MLLTLPSFVASSCRALLVIAGAILCSQSSPAFAAESPVPAPAMHSATYTLKHLDADGAASLTANLTTLAKEATPERPNLATVTYKPETNSFVIVAGDQAQVWIAGLLRTADVAPRYVKFTVRVIYNYSGEETHRPDLTGRLIADQLLGPDAAKEFFDRAAGDKKVVILQAEQVLRNDREQTIVVPASKMGGGIGESRLTFLPNLLDDGRMVELPMSLLIAQAGKSKSLPPYALRYQSRIPSGATLLSRDLGFAVAITATTLPKAD